MGEAGRVDRRRLSPVGSLTDVAVAEAARSLGWRGIVLPEVTLLGGRVSPVVALDFDVHRTRVAAREPPQLDDDTLTIWEWPESVGQAPRPALRLCGTVVRTTRGWASGVTEAMRWRGFGPAGVLGVAADPLGEIARLEAAVDGVGLVAVDTDVEPGPGPHGKPATLLVPAEPDRRAPARRRVADRWLEETLYRHALAHGRYAVDARS